MIIILDLFPLENQNTWRRKRQVLTLQVVRSYILRIHTATLSNQFVTEVHQIHAPPWRNSWMKPSPLRWKACTQCLRATRKESALRATGKESAVTPIIRRARKLWPVCRWYCCLILQGGGRLGRRKFQRQRTGDYRLNITCWNYLIRFNQEKREKRKLGM